MRCRQPQTACLLPVLACSASGAVHCGPRRHPHHLGAGGAAGAGGGVGARVLQPLPVAAAAFCSGMRAGLLPHATVLPRLRLPHPTHPPLPCAPQSEGMAGERSRPSFFLQLGLRAMAAGNTGGGPGRQYAACWRQAACQSAARRGLPCPPLPAPRLPPLLLPQTARATALSCAARSWSSSGRRRRRTAPPHPPTWRRCSAAWAPYAAAWATAAAQRAMRRAPCGGMKRAWACCRRPGRIQRWVGRG